MGRRSFRRWATRTAAAATLAALTAALAACGRTTQRVEGGQVQTAVPPDPANVHTVTVKFDYDFTKTPACSPKTTSKTCIKQFDVYDAPGARYKLFTIPAPAGATGVVKGITARNPSHTFEPGTHFIAVTAENAAGVESDTNAARVPVEVKRNATATAGATPAKPQRSMRTEF